MKTEHGTSNQDTIGYGEALEASRLLGYHKLLEAVLEREADQWAQEAEARVVVLDLPERMRVESVAQQR